MIQKYSNGYKTHNTTSTSWPFVPSTLPTSNKGHQTNMTPFTPMAQILCIQWMKLMINVKA